MNPDGFEPMHHHVPNLIVLVPIYHKSSFNNGPPSQLFLVVVHYTSRIKCGVECNQTHVITQSCVALTVVSYRRPSLNQKSSTINAPCR